MIDSLKNLYRYTVCSRMPQYLLTDEYQESQEVVEKIYTEAPSETRRLLEEIDLKHSMELEAMFQAALSLGQELSRL